jgi:hypothetical protein
MQKIGWTTRQRFGGVLGIVAHINAVLAHCETVEERNPNVMRNTELALKKCQFSDVLSIWSHHYFLRTRIAPVAHFNKPCQSQKLAAPSQQDLVQPGKIVAKLLLVLMIVHPVSSSLVLHSCLMIVKSILSFHKYNSELAPFVLQY